MVSQGKQGAAFVVVDMQNDYCHPDGVYPRHGLSCFSIDAVIQKISRFAAFCREIKIPVIHLRMTWNVNAEGYPIDAGLIVEQSRPFLRQEGLRRGSWGAADLDALSPPDYVIEKTRYSGFHNTALDDLLHGLNIDTVILAGVITNVCVEATARDAFHRDFRVVVLSDCASGFSTAQHDASLATLNIFGRVRTSEEVRTTIAAMEPA